jgi:hypothetical protein
MLERKPCGQRIAARGKTPKKNPPGEAVGLVNALAEEAAN